MKKAFINTLVRVAIISFAVFGVVICAFWYPFSISLSVMGIADTIPTTAQNVQIWTQLVFYWIVSLPCFALLVMAWLITNSIKTEAFFSYRNIKLAKISTFILFADLAVFLIGNVVFLVIGWNDFAIIYFILFAIGLVVATLIKFFERHLKKVVR